MKIGLVAFEQIAEIVPALLPHLQTSARWTRGRASVSDLLRFVLNGQMNLWAVHDANGIHGHVITEIKQYPKCKMLAAQYCAMTPGTMELVEDLLHETTQRFARDASCAGVEFVGRPGWKNIAKRRGYSVQAVMYQKFFEVAE